MEPYRSCSVTAKVRWAKHDGRERGKSLRWREHVCVKHETAVA